MNTAARNWSVVLLKDNTKIKSYPLAEGVTSIGRDPHNHIQLADNEVSQKHAEIVCGPEGPCLRDLDSRNGVLVNGVPRLKANLQTGDRFQIGSTILEIAIVASESRGPASSQIELQNIVGLAQTNEQGFRLSSNPQERQLSTFYHLCCWMAEGEDEERIVSRCLQLLKEAFDAQEVHLYSEAGTLKDSVPEPKSKLSVRLGNHVTEKFGQYLEATVKRGPEVEQQGQQRVKAFNYLIGPLRPNGTSSNGSPFLVLVRPADWVNFDTPDRVFLQAICQLWIRGLAKVQQVHQLRQENAILKEKAGAGDLIGSSKALEAVRQEALRIAATDATLLVCGETGSGKELLTQFIHTHSQRNSKRLLAVNCAAIPDGLIESELFGHVKGAFTGAENREGKFVHADGGSLFLDEIGDLPLPAQAKLLRALDCGEVTPLGSEKVIKVNVRIIAATNRDLRQMVHCREFREDLLYRLDVASLHVPPLRDRLEDIDELAPHLLARFVEENALAEPTRFTDDALRALKQHSWPGNVRELRNFVQKCALAASTWEITGGDVEKQLQKAMR